MGAKSRTVSLTELHQLFERRMLPAPANRITPRFTCSAAPAMPALNRLPRGESAMELPQAMAPTRPVQSAEWPGERGLGVASAAPIWAWAGSHSAGRPSPIAPVVARSRAACLPEASATPQATPQAAPGAHVTHERTREVRIPGEVLRAMAAMAAQTGRDESELWAEAAREWLERQAPGDNPPPAATALAPTLRASRDRCWGAIDILLNDLRAPDQLPVPAVAGLPGAWNGSAA